MSDFMKNLPLSGRPHGDESDVHSDWRGEFDVVLARSAILLDGLGASSPAADRFGALGLEAARARRRIPIRVLARAVVGYLALAREASVAPILDERTSGAVALYLAAKAPTEIRAVTRGKALRATDADWEFGRGPVLEASAVELIDFLSGVSLTAPRPAAPGAPAPPR